MPQKTHKTAHVLNLLSVGTDKEESAEQTGQAEQPLNEKENTSNVQIIDNPKDSSDPLAGLIKDTLEKEILGDGDTEEETEDNSEERFDEDSDEAAVEMQEAQFQAALENEPESQPQPEEPQSAVPTAPPLPVPEPEPEPDYRYVNIMDVLIDKRLDEFMNKFDTCTCDRCKKDVRALAMSNLPPKYIVMPNASYAPLISFYANKYQFNIITELTKACLAIISNPRHDG